MFGYIKPQTNNNGLKGMHQSFMCQVCLSAKKHSNRARAIVGNDVAFFNVLFHSFLQKHVITNQARCKLHFITKQQLLLPDEISNDLADANVLLTFLSLQDKVFDNDAKLKHKIAKACLKKDYLKAKSNAPELANNLENDCLELRKLEKEKCNVFDKVCHPSAMLIYHVAEHVLKQRATPKILNLCYNLGKWVYLVDCIDDYWQDTKNKVYNPINACFGTVNESVFVDLKFLLNVVSNVAITSFNDLNLEFYSNLLKEVLYKTIRSENERVLNKLKGELWVTK